MGLTHEELGRLHQEYLGLPPARDEGLDLQQWREVIADTAGPVSRWAWCDAGGNHLFFF